MKIMIKLICFIDDQGNGTAGVHAFANRGCPFSAMHLIVDWVRITSGSSIELVCWMLHAGSVTPNFYRCAMHLYHVEYGS